MCWIISYGPGYTINQAGTRVKCLAHASRDMKKTKTCTGLSDRASYWDPTQETKEEAGRCECGGGASSVSSSHDPSFLSLGPARTTLRREAPPQSCGGSCSRRLESSRAAAPKIETDYAFWSLPLFLACLSLGFARLAFECGSGSRAPRVVVGVREPPRLGLAWREPGRSHKTRDQRSRPPSYHPGTGAAAPARSTSKLRLRERRSAGGALDAERLRSEDLRGRRSQSCLCMRYPSPGRDVSS